jgi:hypothetical protein
MLADSRRISSHLGDNYGPAGSFRGQDLVGRGPHYDERSRTSHRKTTK